MSPSKNWKMPKTAEYPEKMVNTLKMYRKNCSAWNFVLENAIQKKSKNSTDQKRDLDENKFNFFLNFEA